MKTNASHTEAELKQCSDKLTYAQDSELVSHWQESLQGDSSLGDCVNETNTAAISSTRASRESPSTPTCKNSGSKQQTQKLSHPRHHANPLQSKENVWEALTPEIAYPPSYDKLEKVNPNSSASKTCLDCYQPPLFPEPHPEHISNRCSGSFGQVGTMLNGLLSEQPNVIRSGRVKGFCLLPRPGALSWSGNGRPPGTTKSEAKAKKLGLIGSKEVFNPEWLEIQFGVPVGWTSPQEHRAATELLATVEQHSETASTPESQRSPSNESSTSIASSLKAISLWQPWASLIPLGLKHYETRSWKTNYRGKLLICSTVNNSKHYREYLKVKDALQLPTWDETNFPHGQAIALCDLTDCIQMTAEFIEQQSETEILCGDWQVGRYAWKLENIQPITEPFAVKGKQGLFNIPLTTIQAQKELSKLLKPKTADNKSSDCWYTPPHIVDLVTQVLGEIDLDPCADDGKHIPAQLHYTSMDDGLTRDWQGRVFMNPPYSCPGKWMKKLQGEVESGRVSEAIALVPAATDTNWLSPVLKTQPVCFWKGRIKFLDLDYQPKLPARQSHCLVYWGENWQKFKEVFEWHGFVSVPTVLMVNSTVSTLLEEPKETVLMVNDSTVSTGGSEPTTETVLMVNDSTVSTKRRSRGEGTGRIQWRTITKKNGKQYQQAWYDWQLHLKEKTVSKSTYIPKRLLPQVQQMEVEKAPVREILGVLGVKL